MSLVQSSEIGKIGEDIAEKFFLDRKYNIIERNARYPWGEIDLIVKDKLGILIFIEVKTIRQYGNESISLQPEDNMTRSKIMKLKKTAEFYANQNQKLYDEKRGWRIDFLGIVLPAVKEGDMCNLTNIYKNCEINPAPSSDTMFTPNEGLLYEINFCSGSEKYSGRCWIKYIENIA